MNREERNLCLRLFFCNSLYNGGEEHGKLRSKMSLEDEITKIAID